MRFAAILALVIVGLNASAEPTLPDTGRLDVYLDKSVADSYIPGLVGVVVSADGVLYSHASGLRDIAQNKPMEVDTIFRIASMTKPVTSVAIMMLVEEGKVALDDPASKFLPDLTNQRVLIGFSGTEYESRPVDNEMTVRQLLTHTSGLAYTFTSSELVTMMNGANGSATDYPLVHEPGTAWRYGESTRVLGSIVESVSGQPLEEFMRERIFVPLGMHETWYSVPQALSDRVATTHRLTGDGMVETANPQNISSPPFGDGGLNSTATDYAKFIRMFLNKGAGPEGKRILSAQTIELMGQNHIGPVRVTTQVSTNPAVSMDFPVGAGRDTFGLGFQITGNHRDVGRRPGSMAWAGIFNTEFWIDPAAGIGGVLMMQYLPFYDDVAIETLQGFEAVIYRQLRE